MTLTAFDAFTRRFGIDRYMLMLIGVVILASLLPAQGALAEFLSQLTFWAVALLFFLYGAKLATAEILRGFINWRLQFSCLAATFAVFPLLAYGAASVAGLFLPAIVATGFLYLGCLPSTVQSSIAFTAMSRGNVAGAICAASVSNLIGVLVTPVLFMLVLPESARGGGLAGLDFTVVLKLCQQILAPFVLGQLCRPFLGSFLARHRQATLFVDRGAILLIVYVAFSAGVSAGIWSRIAPANLLGLAALCLVFLAIVMGVLLLVARALKMPETDRVPLLYCGSTKSLASGLPMAGVMFAPDIVAMIALPMMFFHLLQLLACAVISQRWQAQD